MNANHALELLDGLPLSSRIAIEVFHEAMREYADGYERYKECETAFQARRTQAFLTAMWRYGAKSPPSMLCDWAWNRMPVAYPHWAFDRQSIDLKVCQAAGLSLETVGVKRRSAREWEVDAWIPGELSRGSYPDFREILPLPEDNGFTDCSLSEQDWLVVFGAMLEINPENQKRSFAPRSPDGSLADEADRQEFVSNLQRRRPIKNLVDCLKSGEAGDIARFKIGRESVVTTLLDQCVRLSLQDVRRCPNSFDLVAFDNDSAKHPKPEWLTGGKLPYWPKMNSLEAIRQWVSCTVQALEQWQESFNPPAKWDDDISAGLAQQTSQDAMRLVRHVRDQHGITNAPQRPNDESLKEVLSFLDDLERAITATPLETSSGGTTDESAPVAAKPAREKRNGEQEPPTKSRRLNVQRVQGSERSFKFGRKPVTLSPVCANLLNAFIALLESNVAATPANLMAKLSPRYNDNRKRFEDDKRRFNVALKDANIAKWLCVTRDVLQFKTSPKNSTVKAVKKNVTKTSRRR